MRARGEKSGKQIEVLGVKNTPVQHIPGRNNKDYYFYGKLEFGV